MCFGELYHSIMSSIEDFVLADGPSLYSLPHNNGSQESRLTSLEQ